MTKKVYILLILTIISFANTSWADHGKDFLLTQTARLGDAGSIYGISRQDYTQQKDVKAFAFEPLVSWNAYDWLSLEINSHAKKVKGDSFHYEATVAGLRLRLTPKNQPLVLGVATRYGFGVGDEEDMFKFSGLSSYQINSWLIGANINYKKHKKSHREIGYAIGIKRELRHHLELGVEIAGKLEGKKSSEVIIGIFNELTHQFQINAGVGRGINSDVDLTVKTAMIYRFR